MKTVLLHVSPLLALLHLMAAAALGRRLFDRVLINTLQNPRMDFTVCRGQKTPANARLSEGFAQAKPVEKVQEGLSQHPVRGAGWAACLLAGLLVIHHGVLLLGLAGLLKPPLLSAVWLLLVGHGLQTCWELREKFQNHLTVFLLHVKQQGPIFVLLMVVALLAWLAAATGTQAPSVAYDDWNYHLAMPARWLRAGAITPAWDLHHGFFPMLLEMNGLLLMAFAPDQAARWLNPFLALVVAGGIASHFSELSAATQKTGPTPGRLMPLLWLVLPLVVLEMQMLAVEILLALCVVVAFQGFLKTLEDASSKQGWLLLSLGLAAALSQKYTFLPWVVLAGGWAILKIRSSRGMGVGILALGLLGASPVYLRNALWTGNPFYPFMGGVFQWQRAWNEHLVLHYETALHSYGGVGDSLLDFLLLPVRWLTQAEAFHGPFTFALVLLPLAIFALPKTNRTTRLAGVVFLMAVGLWFKASQDIRHLLPWMPVFVIFLGGALSALQKPWRMASVAVLAIVLVIHMAQSLTGGDSPAHRWKVVAGLETPSAYLTRTHHLYSPYQKTCRIVGQGGKVLLMDTLSLCYPLTCPHTNGHLFFQGYWAWWRLKSTEQFLSLTQKRGVTHLLLQNASRKKPRPPFMPPAYSRVVADVLAHHAELVFDENGVSLYRLK